VAILVLKQGSANREGTVKFKNPIWNTVKILPVGFRAPQPNSGGALLIEFLIVPGTPGFTRPEIQTSNSDEGRQRERQRKREGEGCSIPT